MTRLRDEPYTDMPTHDVLVGVMRAVAAEARKGKHGDVAAENTVAEINVTTDVVVSVSLHGGNAVILRQGPSGLVWLARVDHDHQATLASINGNKDEWQRNNPDRMLNMCDFFVFQISVDGDRWAFERDVMLLKVTGADQIK